MVDDLPHVPEAPVPPPPAPPQKAVYFFLSYDLVNSTKYKAQNRGWHKDIERFYGEAARTRDVFADEKLKIWKFIGDEVLFFARLDKSDVDRISEYVRKAHTELIRLVKTMDEGVSAGLLSVKGTAWVAVIHEVPVLGDDEDEEVPHSAKVDEGNIEFNHPKQPPDYIGPDIDIGFRIAKNAEKALLCVSAELASLLPGDENARLARHDEEMRGVWNGRPYPVIWYANNWAEAKKHIWYDDELRSEALADTLRNKGPMDTGELGGHLERVLRDVGHGEKVKEIQTVLAATEPREEKARAAKEARRARKAKVKPDAPAKAS